MATLHSRHLFLLLNDLCASINTAAMRALKQLASSAVAWWLAALLALILFGVEATFFAPPDSLIRALAAWAWLAISCLVLLIAFIHGLLPFFATGSEDSRARAWYLVAFLFPPLLILFDIQGITFTPLNTESTQQVADALVYLHNSRDFGIFDLAFLDYPARQYLLPALPSLIFGTGLITLRIGYAIFYFIAYFSFLSATWACLRHWKRYDAARCKWGSTMGSVASSSERNSRR